MFNCRSKRNAESSLDERFETIAQHDQEFDNYSADDNGASRKRSSVQDAEEMKRKKIKIKEVDVENGVIDLTNYDDGLKRVLSDSNNLPEITAESWLTGDQLFIFGSKLKSIYERTDILIIPSLIYQNDKNFYRRK